MRKHIWMGLNYDVFRRRRAKLLEQAVDLQYVSQCMRREVKDTDYAQPEADVQYPQSITGFQRRMVFAQALTLSCTS